MGDYFNYLGVLETKCKPKQRGLAIKDLVN